MERGGGEGEEVMERGRGWREGGDGEEVMERGR